MNLPVTKEDNHDPVTALANYKKRRASFDAAWALLEVQHRKLDPLEHHRYIGFAWNNVRAQMYNLHVTR